MKTELAIEFGSKNLKIYKKNVGLVFDEPNMVICKKNNKILPIYYGNEAKEHISKICDDEILIKPIEFGRLTDIQSQIFILNNAFSKILPMDTKKSQLKLGVCVSCGLNKQEMQSFQQLLKSMKIRDYNLFFQPICNAQCTGLNPEKTQFIVDFGGGKTEITLIVDGQIHKGISIDLGGNMIDLGISQMLKIEKGIATSLTIIEKIKCEIGSMFNTNSSVYKFWGKDIKSNLTNTYAVISKDITPVFVQCHEKIFELINAILKDCNPEIVASISENGIFFTGNASKIVGLKKYYEQKLNLRVNMMQNPTQTCVAGGLRLMSDSDVGIKL